MRNGAWPGAAGAEPCLALMQLNCSVGFIPGGSNDKPEKTANKQVGSHRNLEN
jgi:hypothetical protein